MFPSARRIRLVIAVAVAAGSLACDRGPESGPGTLTASVVSPRGEEGAALVAIFGEGIRQVSAVEGEVFSLAQAGDTVRVVVVNPDGGMLRFAVLVADTTKAFGGVVLEVAGPDDGLRSGLAGYAVEFLR